METNQNGAASRKVYYSIIAMLLLVNSFTIYLYFGERDVTTDLTSQKTELQQQFKSLSDTLSLRNEEVEQFVGLNTELGKNIVAKQTLLDEQKRRIENLLAKGKITQCELLKAGKLLTQYEASISNLTAKVEQLSRLNQELTDSNQKLSTDLNVERGFNAQLSDQNKGLAKKVEVGSLLPITNVDVAAIKTRSSGREVEVRKVKSAKNLRIKFDTGENKVLDPGTLALYIRIINPKGETIAVADQGSGVLQAAETQEPVVYTKKAEIDYEQANKTVVVYWGMSIQQPGTYKVEVYQSGHVIGEGEVKLS